MWMTLLALRNSHRHSHGLARRRHPGSSPWAGSIAVIGGLLVSTFFTLVLIPTLYVIFEERWPRTLVDEAGEDVEPASDQPT
jgi:hypothetical protein